METPLISIVVPIYNVKPYLSRCVNSIIKQTYCNLQIILVDDGSTDGSAELCDVYRQNDSRIQVLHKENGGAAEARNCGIEQVKGEYLAFVDSDDFIDSRYIETLYLNLKKYDGDISILAYKRWFDDSENENSTKKKELIHIYTPVKAIETLLYTPEILPQSPCAKLYKKSLFEEIRFPVGRISEDIAIIYKLFAKADKIIHSNLEYYYYFQRAGSVVHSEFTERSMDCVYYAEEILSFLDKNMPSIKKAGVCFALSQNIQALIKLPYKEKEYVGFKKQIEENIKKYRHIVLLDNNVTWKRRLGALSTYFGLGISQRLGIIYKQRVNHEKVI